MPSGLFLNLGAGEFSGQVFLKGHSQLWDRADLDTSFLTLKRVHLNLKSKLRVEYVEKSASIFAVFCSIFNLKLKNLFLSVFLLILGHYFTIFG